MCVSEQVYMYVYNINICSLGFTYSPRIKNAAKGGSGNF